MSGVADPDSGSRLIDVAYGYKSGGFQSKLRTRLCKAEVVEIFLRKHTQKSPTVVSRLCGISEKAVRDIWSGRTWSKETQHLDPSRSVCLKKIGRPAGSKDTKPRKPRAQASQKMEVLKQRDVWAKHIPEAAGRMLKTFSVSREGPSCDQAIAGSGLSIDKQLDEWDQQGCWIDRRGLRKMHCLIL
jgi:hypothetical protein